MLAQVGFSDVQVEDTDEHYMVTGRRNAEVTHEGSSASGSAR
jgi:hypothetical protein